MPELVIFVIAARVRRQHNGGMKNALILSAAALLAIGCSSAQARTPGAIVLYGGKPMPSSRVTVASFDGQEQVLQGDPVSMSSGKVAAQPGRADGKAGALTLRWKDAWTASLRVDAGKPLDLRPYLASGTLEFDMNVAELTKGGIYFVMRCGAECYRKVNYVVQGRALQGKGWQRLSFPLSCFARADDDFSKVSVPFALEANGVGQVAVANIRIAKAGKPSTECPDYRTHAVTPEPLSHAWSIDWWMPRHEKKLEEKRRIVAAGRNPQVVFIGDSITEGWEKSGKDVWQRYYAKYDALALGFGGDHTENVLWRLRHGEVDGIAPKVAVLMIGTNNAGDRNDDPKATAAGIKAILDELRQRLPDTKVLLLAIFPREEKPTAFLRRLNEQVNARIAAYADGRHVFFANINEAMLDADGTLSRDVMPDLLHPEGKGYDIWARAMEPILQPLLAGAAPACATTPAPRAVEYPWMSIERWRSMHAAQSARAAQGEVDVMFVGDSLTEMWPQQLWDENFGRFKAANFGIGGDHTGNVLWRLGDPAIAGLDPKLVVLMIGVNNINLCHEDPQQVFSGIEAVVARLRSQYPSARILLNAVLPEAAPDSDERRRVNALNEKVKTLGDGQTVFFHDYSAHFLGAGGVLSKELQPDLLHFSEKGYRVLAGALRPDIEKLMAPR